MAKREFVIHDHKVTLLEKG
jgi:CRP-like cAMP-binding protein